MKTCKNCKYSEPIMGGLACMGRKGMPFVRPTDSCDSWKTMKKTNADRLRAMTDEELAEWVTLMVCKYRSCGNCPMSDWCSPGRGIAEWLKSPVEVEE